MEDDEAPDLLPVEVYVADNEFPKVPLTIITGFLGAGKSSLLSFILTARHGYRIAVIMNEFADSADIESRTINVTSADNPDALSEEVLELANGCLCCSIKDSGAAAIEKLMRKRGRFDYILLETTGLADPGPIASMFWENESMSDCIYLDGVVCVVDGVFGLETIGNPDHDLSLGARQIASSDVILLNKCDIASQSSIERTERLIRSLNVAATMFRTIKGEVADLRAIIGLAAYSSAPFVEIPQSTHHEHGEDEIHEHVHDDQFDGISSLVIPLPSLTASQAVKLDQWLQNVLWEGKLPWHTSLEQRGSVLPPLVTPPLEILRCKGIYSTRNEEPSAQGSGNAYVIQGVQNLYEIREVGDNELPKGQGKLVLIGRWKGHPVPQSLSSWLGVSDI